MTEELEPLPAIDRNDELRRESQVAFIALLGAGKFLVRDEQSDDKGVDYSLEAIVDSRATNHRSQVQLKSTDDIKFNKDGAFSLSVDTSNLNYLLNRQNGLYVLYFAKSRELRYAWVADALNEIEQSKPNWRSQSTVTIRFSNVLNDQSIIKIHQAIVDSGKVLRKFTEEIYRANLGESVIADVTELGIKTRNPSELFDAIRKGGIELVSQGYANQLVKRIEEMPLERRSDLRIRLVDGYAKFSLGRYFPATESLTLVVANSLEELSEHESHLAQRLLLAANCQIGRIDIAEYQKRSQELEAQAPDSFAFQYRADSCIKAFYAAIRSGGTGEDEVAKCWELVKEASLKNLALPFVLNLRIQTLRLEGFRIVKQFVELLMHQRIRHQLGSSRLANSQVERIGRLLRSKDEWTQESNKLIGAAQELNLAVLAAEALLSINKTLITVLRCSTMAAGSHGTYLTNRETLVWFDWRYKVISQLVCRR